MGLRLLIFIFAFGLSATSSAHKPFFSDGQFSGPESAFPIEDIDVSIVLYHEVTCESQAVWLRFDNQAGDLLYHQVGVPYLERMSNYRPVLAVVAPGLEMEDVPFEVPEGMGAKILETSWVQEPEEFLEPFTSTRSWILNDNLLELPAEGEGYVVAWHPEGLTGKLWVAVGTVEDFTPDDIARVTGLGRRLQDFHEQRNHSPRPEMMVCDAPLSAQGGCAASPSSWPLLCMFIWCIARRGTGHKRT
jgi:hypothetical protein